MSNWKPITGYPNYAINDCGEVKSLRFDRILKSANSDNGYLYVNLIEDKSKKTTAVHKLVIEHFGPLQPDPNYIVDHIDNNKTNNQIQNLQWLSISSNTEKMHGKQEEKAKVIKLYKEGYSKVQIKGMVNLAQCTIYDTIRKYERTTV
jgi:hypothetical protein